MDTVPGALLPPKSRRVVKQQSSMWSASCSSTYGYDAAGRFVSAVIPWHGLS